MQLTRHLSSEELSDLILDSDQQHLKQTLGALPEWARSATAHPDDFWERQQMEIRRRIAAAPRRAPAPATTAWVGAFALVLLAILFLYNSPAPQPSRTQTDPDQELLLAVEQTVQSGIPEALEPAAMLADEIYSSSQPTSSSHRTSKENQNEAQ